MLNRWQRTIVDLRGNVVPYAQLQIRVESTQATATIYADRAGNELIPNGIVTADANGYAYFYAKADLYRISSMQPTIDWRYVDIGSANAVRIATEALDENMVTYPTLAELETDTTRDVNSMGRVVNDGSNNGYYLWDGTSWVRTSYQPMQRDEFDDLVLHVENDFLRKDIEQSAPLLRDIPQVGVVGLPYDVDQLYAQIWAARYPGLPAPSFYQIFGHGASMLDPRITFSRSGTATYIKNGRLLTAGIDEPVFERGGFRVWSSVTNEIADNITTSGYSSSRGVIRTTNDQVLGSEYTYIEFEADDQIGNHFVRPEQPIGFESGAYYSFSIVISRSSTRYVEAIIAQRVISGATEDQTVVIDVEQGVVKTHTSFIINPVVEPGQGGLVLSFLFGPCEDISDRFPIIRILDGDLNPLGDLEGEKLIFSLFTLSKNGGGRATLIPTNGQPETMPADKFEITGQGFARAFNPQEGALVFKIGEGSALPYLGSTSPYYAAALWTGDGSISTSSAGGVYLTSFDTDQWRGVGVKAPNKARHNNAIDHNIYPGDTIGISWAGNTINLYVNGVKRGDFTHEDVGEALQAVERFHIHDQQAMYLDTLSLFDTIPTDEHLEQAPPVEGIGAPRQSLPYSIRVAALNHAIFYGQSNSIGATVAGGTTALSLSQPYHNVTFAGGPRAWDQASGAWSFLPLKPLVEDDDYTGGSGNASVPLGETQCSGSANYAVSLGAVRGVMPNDLKILASTAGKGSYLINQLRKGSSWYSNFTDQIEAGKSADADYACHFVGWIQGERDADNGTSYEDYRSMLETLQADAEEDIQGISGQSEPVPMLISQVTAYARKNDMTARAQFDAARDSDRIFIVTSSYRFPYGGNIHFTNVGAKLNGAYFGRAHDALLQGLEPEVLRATSATAAGSVIRVRFDVPHPPMRLDTTQLAVTADYGFQVRDEQGVCDIQTVEVQGSDVVITLASEPQGDSVVRYALDYAGSGRSVSGGQEGCGNLRDSSPDTVAIDGYDYQLFNVSPAFELPVVRLGF